MRIMRIIMSMRMSTIDAACAFAWLMPPSALVPPVTHSRLTHDSLVTHS